MVGIGIVCMAVDNSRDTNHQQSSLTISRWWLLVLIPGLTHISVFAFRELAQISRGTFPTLRIIFAIITGLLILITGLLLFPMPISLFLDARRIRKSSVAWNPNPFLWAGLGMVFLIRLIVTKNAGAMYVAGIYLPIRFWRLK